MFKKFSAAVAASAAVMISATAPAFADSNLTLRSIVVADIGHDIDALSEGRRSEAKIVLNVPAEAPPYEKSANIGGTATIEIALDAAGKLTKSAVVSSTGRPRLDQSALTAVRASTYQAAVSNGHAVAGRYFVDVVIDP